MLSIVGVTKLFITKVVMVVVQEASDQSLAVLALIRIIETIVAAPKRPIIPNELLRQSERFLQLFEKHGGLTT